MMEIGEETLWQVWYAKSYSSSHNSNLDNIAALSDKKHEDNKYAVQKGRGSSIMDDLSWSTL